MILQLQVIQRCMGMGTSLDSADSPNTHSLIYHDFTGPAKIRIPYRSLLILQHRETG